MSTQKRIHSLEDLKQLLPEQEGKEPKAGATGPDTRTARKGGTVRLRLETGGRKGKAVTVVAGLTLDRRKMDDLARDLKQHCGAGGTVKEDVIEIQGDQRERIATYLSGRGYAVR